MIEKATEISTIFKERLSKLDAQDIERCKADVQDSDKTVEDLKQELADARSEMDLIPELDRGVTKRLEQIKEEVTQRQKEVEKTRRLTITLAKSIAIAMVRSVGTGCMLPASTA